MEVKSSVADLGPEVPFYRNKVVGYFVLWSALAAAFAGVAGFGLWRLGEGIIDSLN